MKKVLLTIIDIYRKWISPALPGRCRFAPSCSAYALEAIEQHDSLKGSVLTISRLARCHPFNPGGWDPVPPNRKINSSFQLPDSKEEKESDLECGI